MNLKITQNYKKFNEYYLQKFFEKYVNKYSYEKDDQYCISFSYFFQFLYIYKKKILKKVFLLKKTKEIYKNIKIH